MDYDGLYKDLGLMSKEASSRAAMWFELDEAEAIKKLRFAADCERFRGELFLRGYGGY